MDSGGTQTTAGTQEHLLYTGTLDPAGGSYKESWPGLSSLCQSPGIEIPDSLVDSLVVKDL